MAASIKIKVAQKQLFTLKPVSVRSCCTLSYFNIDYKPHSPTSITDEHVISIRIYAPNKINARQTETTNPKNKVYKSSDLYSQLYAHGSDAAA